MGFIEPPLELFSLERKAAWLPGGLSVLQALVQEAKESEVKESEARIQNSESEAET